VKRLGEAVVYLDEDELDAIVRYLYGTNPRNVDVVHIRNHANEDQTKRPTSGTVRPAGRPPMRLPGRGYSLLPETT